MSGSGGGAPPAAATSGGYYARIARAFERDGYVVVDDILSPQQLAAVRIQWRTKSETKLFIFILSSDG